MRAILVLTLGLILVVPELLAAPPLLKNGSFEEISIVEGSPHQDRGAGRWTLDHSRLATHWRLNEVCPGRLSVLEAGAFAGRRSVRIAAVSGRDAQVFQPVAGLAPGRWYRFSVRIRDGAASLLVYEYRKGRPAPVAKTLVSGTAPKGAWKTITGLYCPEGEDFASGSIVLFVPKGKAATFDDVKVETTGAEAPAKGPSVAFETPAAKLEIGRRGRLLSLVSKANRRELAGPTATTTVLTAVRDGIRYPVNAVSKSGRDLVVSFADPEIKVRLAVTKRKGFFGFEVRRAEPDDLEALELTFPVTPLATYGVATNGTWDDRTGLTHRSVTPNGECRFVPRGGTYCPTVVWHRRHGIRGGRSALVLTEFPKFLAAVQAMEEVTGLPSPKLPDHFGGDGETKRRWARLSPSVGRSYLFVTGYAPGDLDFLIDAAKVGGFDLILFLDAIWKKSAGHYAVREDNFPGGIEGLRAAAEKIHAAGLGFGLHFVGATVSANDAYVTPKPDPRLFGMPCPPLAEPVDGNATILTLSGAPAHGALLRRPPSRFPGHWLQVGDEIVSFEKYEPGPPARFTGVTRGALGTKATRHRKGAAVRSLATAYRAFLVDADSDIVPELGRSLANLVNGAGVDMVYLDAIGTIDPASGIDTWYYLNRLVPALCAGFDRDVLVQTGMGLGRQILWHLVPRSASADGHGDLKGYLDRRLPQIRTIRREFSAADVGWYVLGPATERDQLEYIAARCLALDASISVQASRHILTGHPRAREILGMLERYERCRTTGGLPEARRAGLLGPGHDFRLLEPVPGEWRLFRAEYESVRPVWKLDGDANRIPVTNPREDPVRLEIEISRGRQVATPRDVETAAVFEDFADLGAFAAEGANRYPDHVSGRERVLRKGGLSRLDVADRFTAETEGPGVVLSAKNVGPGGGWMARGRRYDPPRDLSKAAGFAALVKGDGHGQVVTIRLVDRTGAHRNMYVPIGFTGWRYRTFARPTSPGFDWKAVEYLVIHVSRIPRETETSLTLRPLKVLPEVRTPAPLSGLSLAVGERVIPIPTTIGPGQVVTIDALGRATFWPGGMASGRPLAIEGGAITIPPGRHEVRLDVADPAAYPGDLLLRVSRQWE